MPPACDHANNGAEEHGTRSGALFRPQRAAPPLTGRAPQGALFYDSESRNLQSSDRSEEDEGNARALAMQTHLCQFINALQTRQFAPASEHHSRTTSTGRPICDSVVDRLVRDPAAQPDNIQQSPPLCAQNAAAARGAGDHLGDSKRATRGACSGGRAEPLRFGPTFKECC